MKMKIKGYVPATIRVKPIADGILDKLYAFGDFDVSEEGETIIVGKIPIECNFTPEVRTLPNGDPGYPAEYDFSDDVDANQIEQELCHPLIEVSVEVGDFEHD